MSLILHTATGKSITRWTLVNSQEWNDVEWWIYRKQNFYLATVLMLSLPSSVLMKQCVRSYSYFPWILQTLDFLHHFTFVLKVPSKRKKKDAWKKCTTALQQNSSLLWKTKTEFSTKMGSEWLFPSRLIGRW